MPLPFSWQPPRMAKRVLDALCSRSRRGMPLELLLFVVWSVGWSIYSARQFYGYMLAQTGNEWSAPLDDVFIHFDFARATAEGAPLEWIAGNGYSTGNTSVTYPFVLAFGYLIGFRDGNLMQFAAWLAILSMGLAWIAIGKHRPSTPLLRGAYYLYAPLVAHTGVLAWSLWSGMEVAWFLALSSLLLGPAREAPRKKTNELLLGLALGLLFLTRPEALLLGVALCIHRVLFVRGPGERWQVCLLLLPLGLCFGAQLGLTWFFLGETASSGAIVKLPYYWPYLTSDEKWHEYRELLRFCVARLQDYHLSESKPVGVLLLLVAVLPLGFAKTRARGVQLWLCTLVWIALVAMNSQVRWQNQRYLMPALFWLWELVVLGVGGSAAAWDENDRRHRDRKRSWPSIATTLLGILILAGITATATTQAPRYSALPALLGLIALGAVALTLPLAASRVQSRTRRRSLLSVPASIAFVFFSVGCIYLSRSLPGQIWFFGRASRNIRDQQTSLGRYLAQMPEDKSSHGERRVLLGDAGAIPYASRWSAVDFIGLGGFRHLPFARANAHGIPSSIETLEHLEPEDRPAFLAIFPSWWDDLPLWFSKGVVARFFAPGNVICGDHEHVLYRADWSLLGTGDLAYSEAATQISRPGPRGEKPEARMRDRLDVADVASERNHQMVFGPLYSDPISRNAATTMHILPFAEGRSLIWDAGRELWPDAYIRFASREVLRGKPATLIFRFATASEAKVHLECEQQALDLTLKPASHFQEVAVEITPRTAEVKCELSNPGETRFELFHVFFVQ
jgi:hypothetical protein